ncbi:MAG: T9SS type A sorting domain-containing protein [Bacteroidetes bacterium]|nr:T9SS type A sorting domain-containing protein [Bacteroidota bacterium]
MNFTKTISAVSILSFYLGALQSFSQSPDWAQNVAPILYNKCTSCHHSGGIAPFPLITYTDAQPWTSLIQADVQSGKMPPWVPDTTYRHYVHERVLSQQEINTIVTWVNNGVPSGNLSLAPTPPVYNNGSFLGTPDLKLTIPLYTSVASTNDKYQCFSLPTNFPQDRFIRAIEVIPGNKQIVHHVVVFEDTVNTVMIPTVDTSCNLSTTKILSVYVPGATPAIFPNGANVKMGMRLSAGATIRAQIHYPRNTAGQQDSTSVNIFFYPLNTSGIREIYADFLLGNWNLAIPPDSTKIYTARYPDTTTTPVDYSLLSVFPHMHLIGKEIESYSVGPMNDTTKFVKINNWNFHWQDFYSFKKIIKLPAGSTLHSRGLYDNTVNNPNNPNSPPQLVVAGEQTTDEMFLVAFQYLPYQSGDENISLDTLLNPPTAMSEIPTSNFSCYAFPNPTSREIAFQYYLDYPSIVKINFYDELGKKIKSLSENQSGGTRQIIWNIKDENENKLSSGVYFYKIETENKTSSGKIIIQH